MKLRGIDRFMERVGEFPEHLLIEGARQDVHVFSVDRERYAEWANETNIRRVLRPNEESAISDLTAEVDSWLANVASDLGDGELSDTGRLDSIHWLEILVILEEAAGREVDVDAIAACRTPEDLRNFVRELRSQG